MAYKDSTDPDVYQTPQQQKKIIADAADPVVSNKIIPPIDFMPQVVESDIQDQIRYPEQDLQNMFEQDQFEQTSMSGGTAYAEDHKIQVAQDERSARINEGQGVNWGMIMSQALAAGLVGGFDVINKTNNLPSVLDAQMKMRERYDARMKRVKRLNLFVENNPGAEDTIAKLGGMEVLQDYDDAQLNQAFTQIGAAEDLQSQLDYMQKSGHFTNEQMANYRANAKDPQMLGFMVNMDMAQKEEAEGAELKEAKIRSLHIQNETAEWEAISGPIGSRTDINPTAKNRLLEEARNNFVSQKTSEKGYSALFGQGVTNSGKPVEELPGVGQQKQVGQNQVAAEGKAAGLVGKQEAYKTAEERDLMENVSFVQETRDGAHGQDAVGSDDEKAAIARVEGSNEYQSATAAITFTRHAVSAIKNKVAKHEGEQAELDLAVAEWERRNGLDVIKKKIGEDKYNAYFNDFAMPDWKVEGSTFFQVAKGLDGIDQGVTLEAVQQERTQFRDAAASIESMKEKFGLPMPESTKLYADIEKRGQAGPLDARNAAISDLADMSPHHLASREFGELDEATQTDIKATMWEGLLTDMTKLIPALKAIPMTRFNSNLAYKTSSRAATVENSKQILSASGGTAGKTYGNIDFIVDPEAESILPFQVSASYNQVADWAWSQPDLRQRIAPGLNSAQVKAFQHQGAFGHLGDQKKDYPHNEWDIVAGQFAGNFSSVIRGKSFHEYGKVDLYEASTFTNLEQGAFEAVAQYYYDNVNPDVLAILSNLTPEEMADMPPNIQAQRQVLLRNKGVTDKLARVRSANNTFDPNALTPAGALDFTQGQHDVESIYATIAEGGSTLHSGWDASQVAQDDLYSGAAETVTDAGYVGLGARDISGYDPVGGIPGAQQQLQEQIHMGRQENLAAAALDEVLNMREFGVISGKFQANGSGAYDTEGLMNWSKSTGLMDYMSNFTAMVAGPSGDEVGLEQGAGSLPFSDAFGAKGVAEATDKFQEVIRNVQSGKANPSEILNTFVLNVAIPTAVHRAGGTISSEDMIRMWAERSGAIYDRMDTYYHSLMQLDPETRVQTYHHGSKIDSASLGTLRYFKGFDKGIRSPYSPKELKIGAELDAGQRLEALEMAGTGAALSLVMQMGFGQFGKDPGESMGKF
tara:strand:+ start:7690 stop:11136 length:3447 start_codon:yes stop_codon:yes gene_type:complete